MNCDRCKKPFLRLTTFDRLTQTPALRHWLTLGDQRLCAGCWDRLAWPAPG